MISDLRYAFLTVEKWEAAGLLQATLDIEFMHYFFASSNLLSIPDLPEIEFDEIYKLRVE